MIDIERKWLSVYSCTAEEEGNWFLAVSAFRHRWEFGFTCDWHEEGWEMVKSRYYTYAQHFNSEGLLKNQYEFPRKNRWTHVTH